MEMHLVHLAEDIEWGVGSATKPVNIPDGLAVAGFFWEIVENDNQQVPWHDYSQGLGGTWRVILADSMVTHYKPGQILGVKSKCCGNGHNAYWFCGG